MANIAKSQVELVIAHLSHEKKTLPHVPLNPGCLMTKSLCHGLWNNPKYNWGQYFIPTLLLIINPHIYLPGKHRKVPFLGNWVAGLGGFKLVEINSRGPAALFIAQSKSRGLSLPFNISTCHHDPIPWKFFPKKLGLIEGNMVANNPLIRPCFLTRWHWEGCPYCKFPWNEEPNMFPGFFLFDTQ